MKSISKTTFAFSIAIAFIFLSLQSFAQPRGMTMSQVNQQTGRWAANQQMQFIQRMQTMNTNWRRTAGTGDHGRARRAS